MGEGVEVIDKQTVERLCRDCLKNKPIKRHRWRRLKKRGEKFYCDDCEGQVALEDMYMDMDIPEALWDEDWGDR